MTLGAHDLGPKVFALPPGTRFAKTFAQGYRTRFGTQDPLVAARSEILVNTGRTLQEIERSLANALGNGLLPHLSLLSDLYLEPIPELDLPAAISPIRRRLRLTRLVEQFLTSSERGGETLAPRSAAVDLAEALALLIDQFHDEGIDPASLSSNLVAAALPAESARHWETSLRFVDLVRVVWPEIRREEEQGALDPRARQRTVVDALVSRWAKTPPNHPMIAAASTGSVKSTAILMAAIARLPHGAVVLPGFDPAIDPSIWETAEADHPIGPFRNLLDMLDMVPSDVELWSDVSATARRSLLMQAMRPAPVTDEWHRAKVELANTATDATEGLGLIEAETPRHEASAIAIAIREALSVPDRTVAVVTPDAALVRRLTTALSHFGIVPDDSLGKPLAQSPPGVVLRMIAEAASTKTDPVRLSALLNHPITRPGLARVEHLALARQYERKILRSSSSGSESDLLPAWDDSPEGAIGWMNTIRGALSDLMEAIVQKLDLRSIITAHRKAAELLSKQDPELPPEIWNGIAGEQADAFMAKLADNADAFGDDPVDHYATFFLSLLRDEQQRPEQQITHPRVAIWGPREARVLGADLLILAGLNDGIWPAAPTPDPWLSRPMRAEIGLPPPERTVGLSAHDFLQAASHHDVLITRARKVDGAPTVASRWLIRLENLLTGIGREDALESMRARGACYLGLIHHLDRPEITVQRASAPAPKPPVSARPRRLSVTQIETLIRDAYAIYARHILDLRPLDALGRAPDYRERGTIMHTMMERFTDRAAPWPGADAALVLLKQTADETLSETVPWPDLRRIWRARIDRFANWFIEEENLRRQNAVPFKPEQTGELVINLPGGPFTLVAKADRIDRLRSGGGAVYDYKTGAPPSKKQIEQGFNQQLHVQAAILEQGGFRDIPALEAKSGTFIGLTGSDQGGKEISISDLHASVAHHMLQLTELLTAYDNGAGYRSHGRAFLTAQEGDYDHLARRGEWEGEDVE